MAKPPTVVLLVSKKDDAGTWYCRFHPIGYIACVVLLSLGYEAPSARTLARLGLALPGQAAALEPSQNIPNL